MNIECACAIEMARKGKLRVAIDYMIRNGGTVQLNIVQGFDWACVDGVSAGTWCSIHNDAVRRVHEQQAS